MPMRDLLQRARALLAIGSPSDETAGGPTVPDADHAAGQALLIETGRRLAVADRRLAILEASNRTAARAIRGFLEEREQRLAERDAAEAQLSLAVSDRQRTMMLNEQLTAALRDSEDARQRLEDEVRCLRLRAKGIAPTAGPDGSTGSAEG